MKFIVITVLAIGVTLVFVLSENLQVQVLDSFRQFISEIKNPATSTAPIAGRTQNGAENTRIAITAAPNSNTSISSSSRSQNFFPANFKGPTEPPHMIGPSGPPPNY